MVLLLVSTLALTGSGGGDDGGGDGGGGGCRALLLVSILALTATVLTKEIYLVKAPLRFCVEVLIIFTTIRYLRSLQNLEMFLFLFVLIFVFCQQIF